jgi:hypothetical protein
MTTPLEDFKIHMNITDDVDDAILAQKLEVATAWVDEITAGSIEPIPAPVAEATRMLAAHLYESREATLIGVTAQELPFGVMALLDPYRSWF